MHTIQVKPYGRVIEAADGDNLLTVLRQAGLAPDAPCGGEGKCGKCKVLVDGEETLACKTFVHRDMVVTLPRNGATVLTGSIAKMAVIDPVQPGCLLAFDIGTTTLAGVLLEGDQELAAVGISNPQAAFGADVITRIRHALAGAQENLTKAVRKALEEMTRTLCEKANVDPTRIGTVSIVGNPTMQQLYLGYSVDNLAKIPFAPVLTQGAVVDAKAYLPLCENAKLLIVPDIAGFVGADTVGCVLSANMAEESPVTLLVDIGTNGEIVLGNRERMVACAAAAGPALEGANIQFGMRGQPGAIDHVRFSQGELTCSVIGGGQARGICGSGLLDAVAVALEKGWINERGKILTEDKLIHLQDGIFLNQEDIRQVQLAKGAIAAGIELLAQQLGLSLQQIDRVYLAGAFGTYMDPVSACRIGLLPAALEDKIQAVGNGALAGAVMLAQNKAMLATAQTLADDICFVELATMPCFQRCFAKNMRF